MAFVPCFGHSGRSAPQVAGQSSQVCCLSACLSAWLAACLAVRLAGCLFLCCGWLPACVAVRLYVCLPVCLSVWLAVCLSLQGNFNSKRGAAAVADRFPDTRFTAVFCDYFR